MEYYKSLVKLREQLIRLHLIGVTDEDLVFVEELISLVRSLVMKDFLDIDIKLIDKNKKNSYIESCHKTVMSMIQFCHFAKKDLEFHEVGFYTLINELTDSDIFLKSDGTFADKEEIGEVFDPNENIEKNSFEIGKDLWQGIIESLEEIKTNLSKYQNFITPKSFINPNVTEEDVRELIREQNIKNKKNRAYVVLCALEDSSIFCYYGERGNIDKRKPFLKYFKTEVEKSLIGEKYTNKELFPALYNKTKSDAKELLEQKFRNSEIH